MVSRKLLLGVGIVAVVVVLLAIFIVPLLLGVFNPPVDVYARPTPSQSSSPESLLPAQVAGGNVLLEVQTDQGLGYVDAIGVYDGGITIEITLWGFRGDAAAYLDATIRFWDDRSGSMVSVSTDLEGGQHWFTHTESGLSIFGWRKGVWTFEVSAPDEALRNQVVEGLTF